MPQVALSPRPARRISSPSFRIGRVRAYLRGRIWYLSYYENGRRHRPRVGAGRDAARRLAAQINGQLESGACAALSFEPISIPDLRQAWLDHHEYVLRSSVQTINRYRTATEHLLRFLKSRPVRLASLFSGRNAEEFAQYLRKIDVAPNGHRNSAKRRLLDKGVKFILESCRAMFTYAARRRHLSPYAENPFSAIGIDRILLTDAKPIVLFTPQQEKQFLEACDDWQFPIFLTLMLTGMRSGELCHLLVEDVDPQTGRLLVRNKPALGWQVKTRAEREIPLVPVLAEVLGTVIGQRRSGALFRQRRWERGFTPELEHLSRQQLEAEAGTRIQAGASASTAAPTRRERLAIMRTVWRDLGALSEDRIRLEFIRTIGKAKLAPATAPKVLRHLFATSLQEANVDPLVRNILMGHTPLQERKAGAGLGMTAVYTHTRIDTIRQQLGSATARRASVAVSHAWLARRQGQANPHIPGKS